MSEKKYIAREVEEMAESSLIVEHLDAMTREGLHMKSDIARELAWRDVQIACLAEELSALRAGLNVEGDDQRKRRREVAEAPPPPEWVEITIERAPRCHWHSNCKTAKYSGILKIVREEKDRTIFECLSCGQRGYYPVGRSFGTFCSPLVSA